MTNLRITKEQKITMEERLRTKYRCSIFNSPGDVRAKVESYLHIQPLAKCLGLPEISYMLLEADTLESVDGMLEEVQKEILDGRDKVQRLQDKGVPHQAYRHYLLQFCKVDYWNFTCKFIIYLSSGPKLQPSSIAAFSF